MALQSNSVMVSRRQPDLEDYMDMARRYRAWIIGPMFAGLVIATVVVFFWPDTYVSKATLRITPQSTAIVPSDFGAQMNQRLSDMQNEILSRSALEALIRMPTLDLYKREQKVKPMEDVVDQMRKDIDVRITGSPMIGGDGHTMISAFTISFKYPDRLKAQQVVRELVNRFTESNRHAIDKGDQVSANAIDAILKNDQQAIDDLDRKIEKFNTENQGKLPQEIESNRQMLNNLVSHVSQLRNQLQGERDIKTGLESQLKGYQANYEIWLHTPEEAPAAPENRPQAVDPRYTDVLRQLSEVDAKLASLRGVYGENHPAVKEVLNQKKGLEARKTELEKEREHAGADLPARPNPPRNAANTQLAQQSLQTIQNQIDQARTTIAAKNRDIDDLTQQLHNAETQLAQYQGRIDAGPRAAQEYGRLMRDHERLQAQYDADAKKKSEIANKATVGQYDQGESLDQIDPPSVPEEPIEPRRTLYAAAGAAFGLIVGIMLAGVQEFKNKSLKNLKDVRAYTNMPVLSSVPLLENALLVRRKRRLHWLAWSSTLIVGCLAMGASMYYYYSQVR